MHDRIDPDIQKNWQQFIDQAKLPDWIQEMHRHYRETGKYPPEDLRRLLGNPNRAVEIGPGATLASAFTQKK